MKRIFIHAYAAGNLGDDLMVRLLCRRYPSVRFYLYADSTYRTRFQDIRNLKIYAPADGLCQRADRFWKRVKGTDRGMWKFLIRRCDATVHIGGSVFTQHTDNYADALHLDFELRRLSRKLFVVGANFGPYTDDSYYKDYKKLFRNYTDICFRDRYSYELFQDLPNVRYAPDVVFNYRSAPKGKAKKQVLISPIYMESRGGKYSIAQYSRDYAGFLDMMAQAFLEKGWDVKFISFCSFQEDPKIIRQLVRSLLDRNPEYGGRIHVCEYDANLDECIAAFDESEAVIGTRFHSVILGWLRGKRVLPVVYDQKTLQVLRDLDVKEYMTLEQLADFDQAKAKALAEGLEQSRPLDVGRIAAEAENQFSGLDLFLGGGK